jgi:predicted ATP-grasp superfamily ATP-dependent carboligase
MTLSNERYRTVTAVYVGEEFRPYNVAMYKETHEGVLVSFDFAPFSPSVVMESLDELVEWLEAHGVEHGYEWEVS